MIQAADLPLAVLLLEDDDQLRHMLEATLTEGGYEVVAVNSAQAAVAASQHRHFDLVVTDIRMPGEDGLQAVARLKDRDPGLASLVITGYSSEEDCIRAVRLGVGDYLRKPFGEEEFLKAVGQLAHKRRLELDEQRRISSLTSTLLFAVEVIARSLDLGSREQPGPLSLVEASKLSGRLAHRLGVARESIAAVQLATLVVGIRAVGASDCLASLQLETSLPIGHFLRALENGATSIEFEVIRAVLHLLLQVGHRPGTPLESYFSDREVSPALLAALRSSPVESSVRSQKMTLLSLGRGLEEAGNWQAAVQAYQQVQDGVPGRADVQALLALARLAQNNGHEENTPRLLHSALAQAHQIGPSVAAQAALEAGLLLGRSQRPGNALEYLSQAEEIFGRLQLSGPQARSQMARICLCGQGASQLNESLSLLLPTQQREELNLAASWLLPWLAQTPGTLESPAAKKVFARLSLENSPLLESLRKQGRLHPAIAKWLEASSSPGAQSGQSPHPPLRFYTLGGFESFAGQFRLEAKRFASRKTRYLLALLVSSPSKHFQVESVIEEFWPGDTVRGRNSLNQAVSVIRKALRPDDWEGEIAYVIRGSQTMYLDPEVPLWHDLLIVEETLQQAEQKLQAGELKAALDLLPTLLQHYQGPYLEGCYQEWALVRRDSLEQKLGAMLVKLGDAGLQQERLEAALDAAKMALELDSCCQEAHWVVMNCLIKTGRPESALRHFEMCRKTLAQELGIEPSIRLLEAHQRALLTV